MATITRKVCDLCQQDGELADASSTQIGFEGLSHEADLCPHHKRELLAKLDRFLRAMRPVEKTAPEAKARRPYATRPRTPCPSCSTMFTAQGLANHQPSCKGPASAIGFPCDAPGCTAPPFDRAQGLGTHRYRSHGIRASDVLECTHCPLSFTAEERLQQHIQKEHPDVNAQVVATP